MALDAAGNLSAVHKLHPFNESTRPTAVVLPRSPDHRPDDESITEPAASPAAVCRPGPAAAARPRLRGRRLPRQSQAGGGRRARGPRGVGQPHQEALRARRARGGPERAKRRHRHRHRRDAGRRRRDDDARPALHHRQHPEVRGRRAILRQRVQIRGVRPALAATRGRPGYKGFFADVYGPGSARVAAENSPAQVDDETARIKIIVF